MEERADFSKVSSYEFATIFVVIRGVIRNSKNGSPLLTEKSERLIRHAALKIPKETRMSLQPNAIYYSGGHASRQTIDVFLKTLRSGANGQSIISRGDFEYPPAENAGEYSMLWQDVRKRAGVKWYDCSWKKIRAKHWLAAGGEHANSIRKNVEEVLIEIARGLCEFPDANQRVGIVSGSSRIFDLLSFNEDRFAPLSGGNVVKYHFIFAGRERKFSLAQAHLFK
jgi:hypothetical protein